jgi:signal transduction histidine kinase
LIDVINDILDIGKMDADKLKVERIHCSPDDLVDEVATLMRGPAEN